MSSIGAEPRRPRLLPQNRKLRHLRGLSLRNLSLAPTHLRTADDADLHVIPRKNKLRALREAAPSTLQTSRSSDNLRQDASTLDTETRATSELTSVATEAASKTSPRPGRPRRRSSLSFTLKSPASRQKKLEEALEQAAGDVFFSLHVDNEREPVYVSELRHRSANFNFQFFTLADAESSVSRSSTVTVRLWARKINTDAWIYLLEELVDLRRLSFIGTLLDRTFPSNALVFHLEDGVYSLDFPNRIADPKQSPSLSTSSYNALMKLANLQASIEDAVSTQQQVVSQINELLQQSKTVSADPAEEEMALAHKYVAAQQRARRTTEARRDDLKAQLQRRRLAMENGREVQRKAEEDIAHNREKLEASQKLAAQAERDIRGQRRRICSDLSDIFPITPTPHAAPLSFDICHNRLPNSLYDAATARVLNEDSLSASLGLVTLLVYHLQFYLSHPLPYPLVPFGSRSHAIDAISLVNNHSTSTSSSASRRQSANPSLAQFTASPNASHGQEYPLHLPRGGSVAGQWRFEYAWFLLNKNIEALCASQGLKVVDIRHTLPNLKYLLYVCSAGTEEVPERKKGGVRGLWAGRSKGWMSMVGRSRGSGLEGADNDGDGSSVGGESSRRDSLSSEVTSRGEEEEAARTRTAQNGHAKGIVDRGLNGDETTESPRLDAGLVLPFADDAKFTLRTKGLREHR